MSPGELINNEFMLQKLLLTTEAGEVWRALEINVGKIVQLHFISQAVLAEAGAAECLQQQLDDLKAEKLIGTILPHRVGETAGGDFFFVSSFDSCLPPQDYAAYFIQNTIAVTPINNDSDKTDSDKQDGKNEELTVEGELSLDDILSLEVIQQLHEQSELQKKRTFFKTMMLLESPEPYENVLRDAQQAEAKDIIEKVHFDRRWQFFFQALISTVIIMMLAGLLFALQNGCSQNNQKKGKKTAAATTESKQEETKSSAGTSGKKTPAKKTEEFDFSKKFGTVGSPNEMQWLGTAAVGKTFVFVIDASAPMGSGKSSPWEHAIEEVSFTLRDMTDNHQFQAVFFNETPNILADGDWLPATAANKKKAVSELKAFQTAGKGNPKKALLMAVEFKPEVIFFITDQKCQQLTAEDIAALKKAGSGIKLNAAEIGSGMTAPKQTAVQDLVKAFRGNTAEQYQWDNAGLRGLKR